MVAALGGCQEYNITDASNVAGAANPAPVEPPVRVDRIVQVTTPSVDVLWVVDNSCSMDAEQTGIATNAPVFMDYFVGSGLDWHVGVVSTDMNANSHSAKLQRAGGVNYLDEDTPNATQLFSQMTQMGISGSSDEKGRQAVYHAIETLGDSDNAGFYRENASLAVVVISDEQDQTTNNPSLQEFISWLTNLKPDLDMVSFSSIVCLEASTMNGQQCGTGIFAPMTVGEDYLAVTDAVGGVKWEIRDTRWDTVLNELGMQAAGLKREFFLADIPVPETIKVTVSEPADAGGEIYEFFLDSDFSYSATRNSIQFLSYVPMPLAEVFIEYELLSAQFDNAMGDTDTGR